MDIVDVIGALASTNHTPKSWMAWHSEPFAAFSGWPLNASLPTYTPYGALTFINRFDGYRAIGFVVDGLRTRDT